MIQLLAIYSLILLKKSVPVDLLFLFLSFLILLIKTNLAQIKNNWLITIKKANKRKNPVPIEKNRLITIKKANQKTNSVTLKKNGLMTIMETQITNLVLTCKVWLERKILMKMVMLMFKCKKRLK